MKYIRNGKTIDVTERLYNMVYKQIGYKLVEEVELKDEVLDGVEVLEDLTVVELQEKAEALKLENYKGLKKADLVKAIEGA